MQRILVCTNHLRHVRGSELVTLELVEEFSLRGWHVDLYSNLFMPPMAGLFDEIRTNGDIRIAVDPYEDFGLDYDLIWVQHNVMPSSVIRRLAARPTRVPIVWNHMSSIVHEELPLLADVERQLADVSLFVSDVVADRLRAFGLDNRWEIWSNPSPRSFVNAEIAQAAEVLGRLVVVSNNPAPEVTEAAELLRGKGIVVDVLGEKTRVERLSPQLLAGYDAVLSIGKSVQYALTCGRPVYVYGDMGGSGWLTPETFDDAASWHFSGRDSARKLGAHDIADEIVAGYGVSHTFVKEGAKELRERYSLQRMVDQLLADEAIAQPSEKAVTREQSLRWENYNELLRGSLRTIEHLSDSLAAANTGRSVAMDQPEESTEYQGHRALTPGLVEVRTELLDDSETTAAREVRARVIVGQQTYGLIRAVTGEIDRPDAGDAEFLAFVDGRCSWRADLLEHAIAHLQDRPEEVAVVVGHATAHVPTEDGHGDADSWVDSSRAGSGSTVLGPGDILGRLATPLPFLIVRSSAMNLIGPPKAWLGAAAGWEWAIRLMGVGEIGSCSPKYDLGTWYWSDQDASTWESLEGKLADRIWGHLLTVDSTTPAQEDFQALRVSRTAAAELSKIADDSVTVLSEELEEIREFLQTQPGIEARVFGYFKRIPNRVRSVVRRVRSSR